MKIRTDHFKNTSPFEGRSGSATLNMDRLSLFMDNMISNYNKPELAVLREWVSNAHDAHVAAGIKKPVKVTLPSALNPTLVVQDFGLGMTPDFVENVYLDFGSSSKSMSNDEIGGFGIGGKSALAIASQYTMTTIAEGYKSVYIFERSPKGGVDFKNPIHMVPTDEPSGVTVTVAVDRWSEFSDKNINRVLAGWSNSDIELSTGKKFFSIPDNGTEVSFEIDLTDYSKSDEEGFAPDIRAEKGYVLHGALDIKDSSNDLSRALDLSWNEFVVVVGPVAYIFQPELNRAEGALRDYMVASVNIGDVSFPSSREVIEPTRSNRRFVGQVLEKVALEAAKLLQLRADNVSDHKSALTLHRSPLAKAHKNLKIQFKGEDIPLSFNLSQGDHLFSYQPVGNYRGIRDFRLMATSYPTDAEIHLDIETLVILDSAATENSIRNNVRLVHGHNEDDPKKLSGNLLITKNPNEWVKAAARRTYKSSELAELAKTIRREKKDALESAKAAGVTSDAPVRRTRRDRIGEYQAYWLSFDYDEAGQLQVTKVDGTLMDFYDSAFDPKKKLSLSTNSSDFSPLDFSDHFSKFGVNPSDVQFLKVYTGAKLETLRIVLGEETEIVNLRAWLKENFTKHAKINTRTPQEIAKEIPFDFDRTTSQLFDDLGYENIHPKYKEIAASYKELEKAQESLGLRRGYYYPAESFLSSILKGYGNDVEIDERPEFYFLSQMGYYSHHRTKKNDRAVICQTLNRMMEHWLDNLAIEEAEAQDAELEQKATAETLKISDSQSN